VPRFKAFLSGAGWSLRYSSNLFEINHENADIYHEIKVFKDPRRKILETTFGRNWVKSA
jgi:hypothetical protein